MWTYVQLSGGLYQEDKLIGMGYSGAGAGKNNPHMENVAFQGPIPVGLYTIGEPYDSADHGPYVLPLMPDAGNEMYGRDAFLMHGDSKSEPGTASEGCIIMPRGVREDVWESGDHDLCVISWLEPEKEQLAT